MKFLIMLIASLMFVSGCSAETQQDKTNQSAMKIDIAEIRQGLTVSRSVSDTHGKDIEEVKLHALLMEGVLSAVTSDVKSIISKTEDNACRLEDLTSIIIKPKPMSQAASLPGNGGIKLQLWTATWCGYCPAAKAASEQAASRLGIVLEIIDADANRSHLQECKVTSLPTLCIVEGGYSRHWIKGNSNVDSIIAIIEAYRNK